MIITEETDELYARGLKKYLDSHEGSVLTVGREFNKKRLAAKDRKLVHLKDGKLIDYNSPAEFTKDVVDRLSVYGYNKTELSIVVSEYAKEAVKLSNHSSFNY